MKNAWPQGGGGTFRVLHSVGLWSTCWIRFSECKPKCTICAERARADEVHIDYQGFDSDLAAIDTFGAALRRFGTLHQVSLGQGYAAAIEHLLAALGPQPELTDLYCFDGDLSDAASRSLAQFPRLKNLAIVGASFTGADFPRLPALTTFDCSWNPTTLPGLRRIAACPLLKKLKLREPDEGSAEYRQSVATLRTEHPALEIFGME